MSCTLLQVRIFDTLSGEEMVQFDDYASVRSVVFLQGPKEHDVPMLLSGGRSAVACIRVVCTGGASRSGTLNLRTLPVPKAL